MEREREARRDFTGRAKERKEGGRELAEVDTFLADILNGGGSNTSNSSFGGGSIASSSLDNIDDEENLVVSPSGIHIIDETAFFDPDDEQQE